VIYKLMPQEMWQSFEASGRFEGAPVDIADGYIHFSAASQVIETASKHFAGVDDLMLVAVDPDSLGDALRWEPSRGGALFPHLYASLPLAAVVSVVNLARGADGNHVFPALAE
jgi:uncharacterized protein (DUF952 family)